MRKFIAAFAFLTLSACGGDSSTNPSASIVGTYTLQSINGAPLPFIAQAAAPRIEVLSGQAVINVGGTYTASNVYRTTSGSTVSTTTDNDAGTYTTSGTAVAFTSKDGSVSTGTIGTGTVTVAEGGFSFLYKK